jgi:3-methyladenine DNA glycosylase/8-oxoguanine DNA glycosylase
VTPDAVGEFAVVQPLDLNLTLGPLSSGPWLRHLDGAILRATRTPAGAATMRLERRNGSVHVQAWGAGAQWSVDNAAGICGQIDDDTGFVPAHPLIKELHRQIRGIRMPRTRAVFEALVPTVLTQLVTTEEARESYKHMVNALGEPAPGPYRLKVPPGPDVYAAMPYWQFHRFGVERRRADIVVRAARSAKRLEETTAMGMEAAYQRLLAFPGVGPWTAAKVAMVALGDADAVPVGDYHLPHSIGYALEGTARSSDGRMLELLEPYRGHRARVIRLITAAGIIAPRFGPRKPLRNILNS